MGAAPADHNMKPGTTGRTPSPFFVSSSPSSPIVRFANQRSVGSDPASDGTHLWSERYDRELADVFALQDQIAQAIATALHVKLTLRPESSGHTPKLPAYEAFLRGRQQMLRHSPVALQQAIEYLEQSISLDPEFEAPHASLGLTYFLSTMASIRSSREMMRLILAEAKEALSFDPTNPDPHFLLASVPAAYEYDWTAAVKLFALAQAETSTMPEMPDPLGDRELVPATSRTFCGSRG